MVPLVRADISPVLSPKAIDYLPEEGISIAISSSDEEDYEHASQGSDCPNNGATTGSCSYQGNIPG